MPYLLQTCGPTVGKAFALAGDCVLGRNSDCDVVVPHDSVSRHHAKIRLSGSSCFVEDLNSRNGTTVNNIILQGRYQLADGDTLRLSGVEFSYRDSPFPELAARATADKDTDSYLIGEPILEDSAVQLSIDVDSHLDMSRVGATAPAKLGALLDITQSLGKFISLDKLLPKILDCLFTMIPQAEQGCVALRDEAGQLVPMWKKSVGSLAEDNRVSQTIVEQAIHSKKAILSTDACHDPRFRKSESIPILRIRSVMCAPLIDENGDAFGVVQLETGDWKRAFEKEELELLIGVASQAAIAITIARLHENELKRQALERDLELAAEVQHELLPEVRPKVPGYEFSDYYEPAAVIGGDYYDYVNTPSDRLAVIIADVVGHGIAAALSMSKLSAEVRLLVSTIPKPERILNTLNRNMWRQRLDARFITLLIATLDPQQHELTLACAGHMPPILRRRNGQLAAPGREQYGPPLGAVKDCQYFQHSLCLEPGDTLALYTDGITEARNDADEMYGETRLKEQIAQASTPTDLAERIIRDLKRFAGTRPHQDDICLVCFGRRESRG